MAKTASDYRAQFKDRSTQLQVLAATDDQASFIAPKSADHTLYIQRITIAVTTYSAKTWTFQDSAGTPVPIWHISIPAAAVALPSESNGITIDFGARGVALTAGKGLSLDVSAAGAAGMITVEAYEKLNSVATLASTN